MNNGIFAQDVYGKVGFEERLPKSLSGPPSVVNMPYHYPPANDWKNNTQQCLILVHDTTKQNNTTISFPYGVQIVPTNFIIDWGDGTCENIVWGDNGNTRSTFHTYSSHGVYTVIIRGSTGKLGRSGSIPVPSLIRCLSFGNIGLNNLLAGFQLANNLIECPPLLPSAVTNIGSLFGGCTIFNDEKIKYWDTTNVTAMNAVFLSARAFNQDVGSWNTSNVTITQSMFENATSFNNGNSDSIKNWNVSNVTNMQNMFTLAVSFNQNLDNWNVSKCTTLASMFDRATNFNGSLSGWSPGISGAGCSCASMFSSASNFNQPLDSWNTSNVTNMGSMFASATAFKGSGLENWNLAGLNVSTALTGFAAGCSFPTGQYDLILNSWNTNKASGVNGVGDWRTALSPHFGTSKYTAAGSGARASLISYGWTITDGGLQT